MSKRSPRLQFTDEERAAPELKKAIQKADKKADKLDKAEAKIPKKTVKRKERVVDAEGKVTTRSFRLTVFFGIFASALSSLSAFLSAF